MQKVIPKGVEWVKKKVDRIQPQQNLVYTTDGVKIKYDVLVVAAGAQVFSLLPFPFYSLVVYLFALSPFPPFLASSLIDESSLTFQVDYGRVPGLREGLKRNQIAFDEDNTEARGVVTSSSIFSAVGANWRKIKQFAGDVYKRQVSTQSTGFSTATQRDVSNTKVKWTLRSLVIPLLSFPLFTLLLFLFPSSFTFPFLFFSSPLRYLSEKTNRNQTPNTQTPKHPNTQTVCRERECERRWQSVG
eukprot:TRINITY_DN442_c0_g1_i6.p1 TRINITY_DN442_c0_g1~~TRINITY_DN442_c0_g1_i6.p1  ORF type:complete len:244 (-),score=65.08 TRINITY_DN442_c0_g1_i6:473-1204(-)